MHAAARYLFFRPITPTASASPPAPPAPSHQVIIRGSSLCEDGSYDAATTIKPPTKPWIAGCEEKQAPWQCGTRALCSQGKADTAASLSIQCACPAKTTIHPEFWGYPYGGGDSVPGSEGFSGCFEQWNTDLTALTADGCLVTPAFNVSATPERAIPTRHNHYPSLLPASSSHRHHHNCHHQQQHHYNCYYCYY